MTRRHYVALAAALASTKPEPDPATLSPAWLSSPIVENWRKTCEAVADVCARDNPRFDRDRFLDACHGLGLAPASNP